LETKILREKCPLRVRKPDFPSLTKEKPEEIFYNALEGKTATDSLDDGTYKKES